MTTLYVIISILASAWAVAVSVDRYCKMKEYIHLHSKDYVP